MKAVEVGLGAATADAEQVALRYDNGTLVLTFVDWREQPCELRFEGVLAFRWQEPDDHDRPTALRDDMTYELVDSPWLARQAALQAVDAAAYAHYILGFNTSGVLDVLCRRLQTS